MKKTVYRSIFISDIHLGSKNCKAKSVDDFLKNNNCETLYLVGDIIDGWKFQQNRSKWKNSHSDVIRRLLKLHKDDTKIIYIPGNHDEFVRMLLPYELSLGNITLCNEAYHIGVDGKKYLIVHGDFFDGITRLVPWISFLGDKSYDLALSLNSKYNWIRHKFGFGYWSFSKFLKHRVKKAVDFIFQFEKTISHYCKRKECDGVICGHIHHAEIKNIDGVMYMNCGDWVESLTALVEHHDGRFELIHYTQSHQP
jgi:UDP-2,3-diacylglucosamine pyrophosphatase LpxH